MTDTDKVTGDIEIVGMDWTITPDSLKKGNEKQLLHDILYINKVNPGSGLTFLRHIKGVSGRSGCEGYLKDPNNLSKCIIAKKKAGLI